MLKSVKAFVLQPFVNKFASLYRLITPTASTTMAVIRNTSSARRVGRVGNTTYYVSNGQQIARQSRNDSNYGVDASRSRAQQMRRVRWSNLVNVYKACRGWMPKAFESKKTNQSDYNKFMSLNINSSTVFLTKDQAVNGCAVMANYIVSQGSLPPINYQGEGTQGTNVVTSIKVGNIPISGATVAEITSAVLSNNPEFQDGDNIAIVLFKTSEPKAGYPYTSASYAELTLDSKSTKTLASLPVGSWLDVKSSAIAIKSSLFDESLYQCVAVIHTRKIFGQLMTSTQHAYCNITDYWDEYANDDALEAAIQSYGVTEDVPLDPSFKLGSIIRVSIDGVVSPQIKGSIVEHRGACSLTVVGDNLTADNYELRFDDTVYTPLIDDENSKTYILSNNGTARIYVNGVLYGGVRISGIVLPTEITDSRRMGLMPTPTSGWSQAVNVVTVYAKCINYNHKIDDNYTAFNFTVGHKNNDLIRNDFSTVNCTIVNFSNSTSYHETNISFSIDDADKIAFVQYKGLIIAVFNY